MTYRICLGSLVLSVGVLLMLQGAASATELTSPTGTVTTSTLKFESEGHATLDIFFNKTAFPAECQWALEGNVENHGENKPAVVPLNSLALMSCTKGWHVTTLAAGKLEIASSSGYDGTVTWTGGELLFTLSGVTCRYKAEGVDLGTLIGGSPATLNLEASLPINKEASSILCGEANRSLTGSIKASSPEALFVDKSGTTITSPTGTVATPTIKAESEGHVAIDHPLATFQCQWAFEGSVASHTGNALIPLSSLTTSGCTDSWHATTVAKGKLEVSSTGGYNGTIKWTEGTVEMTRLGTTCRYKADKTVLGTITGGTPATIDIEGKLLPDGGSPLCGEEAYPLTGSLKVTSPSSLFVDRAT